MMRDSASASQAVALPDADSLNYTCHAVFYS